MSEQPIQVDVHDKVREQLKKYIIDVGLQPSDRLPSEHQLVKTLGVSRSALREVLRSFEALGLIEAQQGKGRYLRQFDFEPLADNLAYSLILDKTSMSELLAVRRILEVGFLPQAIDMLQEEDIEQLRAIVKGMRSKTRGGETYSADEAAFHRTLFRGVENDLLQKLLVIFWELLQHVSNSGALLPAQSPHIVEYHARIVEVIRRRDVREAQRLLDEHFDDLAYRIRQVEL